MEDEKEHIKFQESGDVDIRRQRAEVGKLTAFQYNGVQVDDKKQRRQAKESLMRDIARQPFAASGGELRLLSGSAFQVSNSM